MLIANQSIFRTIHWGDAPTWLTSVGTIAALVFALGIRQAANTLELQRRDSAARDERDRRAHELAEVGDPVPGHHTIRVHSPASAGAEMVLVSTYLVGASDAIPTDVYEAVTEKKGVFPVFDALVEIPDGQLDGVGESVDEHLDQRA
jgi:hypothetical protein